MIVDVAHTPVTPVTTAQDQILVVPARMLRSLIRRDAEQMAYGRHSYAGGSFAGSDPAEVTAHTEPILAVEVAFTTNAFDTPVWEDIAHDVRSWSATRGRRRELERFQPGRATITLSNRQAQYDSQNVSGPHYGNLRPMRRMRIRETFQEATYGIFDGYVDSWDLDYPGFNKDAVATLTATDGFKVFARTDLPLSAYHSTVDDDLPAAWWRLDESKSFAEDAALTALNYGSDGVAADGTYVGPPELGGEALIVKDPGSSIQTWGSVERAGAKKVGVSTPVDLFSGGQSWVVECWCIPKSNTSTTDYLWSSLNSGATGASAWVEFLETVAGSEWSFRFFVQNDAGAFNFENFVVGAEPSAKRYHVVAKWTASTTTLEMWVDGVSTGTQTRSGAFSSGNLLNIGYSAHDANNDNNWFGSITQFSVYKGAQADAVDQAWVDEHFATATTPWQGDTPATRINRVLDLVEWPSSLRILSTAGETLQSAALDMSALEHLQKVGETNFGAVFIDKTGNVRFIERGSYITGGTPVKVTVSDNPVDNAPGYRVIAFDDGSKVLRNKATISRYQGVAKTATDSASVTEFGTLQYTLEGLLHQSDSFSQNYADFIVLEYGDLRRRITQLELGPPITGEESKLYPQMLARELTDGIDVVLTPLGGVEFALTCRIEGIEHAGQPGGVRSCRWMLSPDFVNSF